jgi:type I restriction enzyme M protein
MAVKKSELYSLLWEACNKLRGGVEPSRYKDYVLVLLFFKYVSDRYKGQRFAEFTVNEGASFDDLIAAKGKPDVGERVDKIIQKFLEENRLQGSLPDVSFNNPEELGHGKELVDKVSGLIAIFQNPAIDFKSNRASGDDIIGDAYEYFMMKFAQESGKSKGQFYTPSEVSRTIARLIGIGEIKQETDKKWTLHDPAAGSGSLLIRAADEAPIDENGDSIVTIFGQEKYPDTAGLAKMNFILHNKGTGEIKSGNTLANPQYTDDFGGLKKFDFIVMNPPFSDKDWTDGIKPSEDDYKRFDGYGIPPAKNGDYAWFLHVLKALDSDHGKAGIILPHGVLFRGNAEETIRKEVLDKRYIKGIVGLPENLFYGTGIPASIIIIDKEKANEREGIFMIDASNGFKKDGNKNRLREQDIEKIVQTFLNKDEVEGYSRFITYKEILEDNDGNLSMPRYIQKVDNSLPQNIKSHLEGGIPESDIDSIERLWRISPELKEEIFICIDGKEKLYKLTKCSDEIERTISEDKNIINEKENESVILFKAWKDKVKDILLNINLDTNPKELIREIGIEILNDFEAAKLLDNYDIYDFLLNYWNEKLQDDVYIIKTNGYESGREIEYVYAQKKAKDEFGEEIKVDDTSKLKSFDGALIPREVIEREYFKVELTKLNHLHEKSTLIESELEEMREEESDDEGLLVNVLNEKGDGIPKTNLNKRIAELESKKTSPVVDDIIKLLELFDLKDISGMEELVSDNVELGSYELRNKNGSIGKAKLRAALKLANEKAIMPEPYVDEYNALLEYQSKISEKDEIDKSIKEEQKQLDELVINKYGELSIDEIKHLLFEKKWMLKIENDIKEAIDQVLNNLASKVVLIAKRYEQTLGEIEEKTAKSKEKVKAALERMGYTW